MSLRKTYVRDFHRNIIGNVTSGFDNEHGSVIRDNDGHVLGRTSTRYNESRDTNGRILSSNSADPGLILRKK